MQGIFLSDYLYIHSVDYTKTYEDISALLVENADSDNAVAMSKYMRDQFAFYGIRSPLRKELRKEIKKIIPAVADDSFQKLISLLWDDPHRECQYMALELMGRVVKKMDVGWVPYLVKLVTEKSWWDTVDCLAPSLLGTLFIAYPEKGNSCTEKWIRSDNLWLQRSALIYQLRYRETVDEEKLYRYIRYRKESSDFFIRKAAGWALREYSKVNPKSVRNFLSVEKELAPLTIREASKYLAL